jgi:hypothetical protein
MTSNSLSKVSEEFSREIRKLEARLENFLKEEEAFVKELRSCIAKLKELDSATEKLGLRPDPEEGEELIKLRSEVTKAFSETLKKESKAEHEKSHLLESYGALILALEEFKNNLKKLH